MSKRLSRRQKAAGSRAQACHAKRSMSSRPSGAHRACWLMSSPLLTRRWTTSCRSGRARSAGLLLVCDGIVDPHNLGALIRSAEAAGAHGVIIGKASRRPA